ncbi:GGDEF domain-containing protein [Solirubrobacter soli]|uniref:GGDEF domain-containing protein n=1 Tax=Solirubrobacter soli TaxID=363832 RepID=UPI0004282971|nr:sensor domain-containing diguanylate cyclase [Solirubrobacter soli]
MQVDSATRVVHGLEAIIDAAAGVLSQKSLTATLDGMVRELQPIVPFTSLAVYEADHDARVLVPVYAVGRWVEETLANRPGFDTSHAGGVVQSGELAHLDSWDTRLKRYTIPGTPVDEHEAIVIAPLTVGETVIGTLVVWREEPGGPVSFSPEEAQLFRRFATLAALAYANARQREQLLEQAATDALTGLANRRVFHERLAAELARGRREGRPVSLALFDVDDFKSINDNYGHPAGDAALRGFAQVLSGQARASDVVCRVGGEEFAAILAGADAEQAAEYARRALGVTRVSALGPRPVTASAGVATAPDGSEGADELFRRADEQLLAAKRCGKDRVAVSTEAHAGT